MKTSMTLLLIIPALLFTTSQCQTWMTVYDQHFQFTCPDGQALKSLESHHDNGKEDRVWNFHCAFPPLEAKLERCEWSEYVNDFDALVSFQCPNEGVITGVESYHDNGKEDRRFKFRCCNTPAGYVAHGCSFSAWANTYDNDLNYRVPDDMILKGVESVHDNHKEDRIFKFEICKLDMVSDGVSVG